VLVLVLNVVSLRLMSSLTGSSEGSPVLPAVSSSSAPLGSLPLYRAKPFDDTCDYLSDAQIRKQRRLFQRHAVTNYPGSHPSDANPQVPYYINDMGLSVPATTYDPSHPDYVADPPAAVENLFHSHDSDTDAPHDDPRADTPPSLPAVGRHELNDRLLHDHDAPARHVQAAVAQPQFRDPDAPPLNAPAARPLPVAPVHNFGATALDPASAVLLTCRNYTAFSRANKDFRSICLDALSTEIRDNAALLEGLIILSRDTVGNNLLWQLHHYVPATKLFQLTQVDTAEDVTVSLPRSNLAECCTLTSEFAGPFVHRPDGSLKRFPLVTRVLALRSVLDDTDLKRTFFFVNILDGVSVEAYRG
jgi:hypothetical protein